MIPIGHVVIILFGPARMRARPTQAKHTPYIYAPRTFFTIGRLLHKDRDAGKNEPDS